MTESVSDSGRMFSQLYPKSCKAHDSLTLDQALEDEEKTLILTSMQLAVQRSGSE